MDSARGLANHCLYMARLQLVAWQDRLAQAETPQAALNAAFAPAVRLHLLDAYGWFLLASCRASQLPDTPPHSTHDMPAAPAGIGQSDAIAHCKLLEADRNSWLAQLQAPIPPGLGQIRRSDNLAMAGYYPDQAMMVEAHAALADLIEQWDDSVDEC